MVAPQGNSEQVRYDIIIEAKAALQSLREMLQVTDNNQEKIVLFSRTVIEQSKAMGIAWQDLLATYRQLNAELSKGHKATVFGNVGGQDLFKGSEQYIKTLEDAGRLTQNVTEQTDKMGNTGQSATSKFAAGLHLVRIALGALEAMLIFNIVQAIQTAFGTAIKNAKELEASMYRLHNAERILSQEGINITTKGLEDGIKRIKALFPIFSKEDITGEVGQIAIMTKALGLTEKQILDLANAVAIYNVNSVADETLQQTTQRVIVPLLTSNAKGVADLGIKLGDAAIQAKALEMGILRAGESVSALTAHEKDMVKFQIIIDTAKDSVSGLNEYLTSNTGKIQANKAAWNDLMTTFGQILLPLVPVLTSFLKFANDGFNALKVIIITVMSVLEAFYVTARLVANGSIKSFDDLKTKFHEVAEAARKMFLNIFFPEGMPENAPEWFKKIFGGDFKTSETPTGKGTGLSPDEQQSQEDRAKMVAETEQKLQDIMQESADKKADIEREYGQKLQDIATNYSQKLEDIARETTQKREDALTDYNNKVSDINRDSNQKIEDAQRDWRQKEIDRQKEFQNRMRELRDKFLMDLEDALHERDARQVLRLIRQYNLDKKNLEERNKLERIQSKKDLQAKLQDIEIERQRKLEAAQREYQDKLQQIAIGEARARAEAQTWYQRQLADANLWHQRQLQEQQQYLQRKLRDLAQAIMQEYQLTAQGAQSIYSLLSSYFGTGGSASNLLSGFSSSLSGGSTTTLMPGTSPGIGSGLYNPYDVRTQRDPYFGHAEGGSLVATRPTKAVFGEAGPELVSFTPLDRPGNNMGKVFGDKSALGGLGGDVRIRLDLSPDLRAEIVDSSLESVALHLEKVVRSK